MDRRFLRPGWLAGHLLVLLAALVCLRLGWWQWERTHEASGTAQNLGYAVLWPCFAAAFIYMWVRFLQLEQSRDALDDEEFDQGLNHLLDAAAPAAAPGGPPDANPDDQPPAAPATLAIPSPATPAVSRDSPSRAVPLSTATVGLDDDDDPELTAYNRALAALAERDRRRAP